MNDLEIVVKKAVEGDKKALEEVVLQIQDFIYNLAIRMLWHPDDAKDATQDILIKVITNLSKFNNKSAFTTWVYRLSSNNLINFKKKKNTGSLNFDQYELQLNQGFSNTIEYTTNKAEQSLLIQEAKIGCSNAMLQCLNKESRITYIIGEILEFNGYEGGIILNITPENFRKKLSRARKSLHNFLNKNCGIVNKQNTCRCHKKVDGSIKNGFIQPTNLLFTKNIKDDNLINTIESISHEVNLYQTNPNYTAPDIFLSEVRRIVTTAKNV
ncbi:MAG: RNA polymerase subunit sigma-70 [Bacteroidetes bacterium]|nr:MAG: RNA polymerase subunit sigma-70 [Bacteroidota bacterium]